RRALIELEPDDVRRRLGYLDDVGRSHPYRLSHRRRHHQGAGVDLRSAVALVEELAVGGGEPVVHPPISAMAEGQAAAVPHSAQNFAPLSSVPQLAQNFLVSAGAAASGAPQLAQNLPPPVSAPHFGHIAVPVSRKLTFCVKSSCWIC